MTGTITEYPLNRFDELVPLLMRCFPDFWEPRLKRGLRSFPYDLKLFTAEMDSNLFGCIGLHDYPFYMDNQLVRCYGVSDVAVDPDYRGKGYSYDLQRFVLEYSRNNPESGFLPLYTDKPGVYRRLGWTVYESDRSSEIRVEDFPKKQTFRFDIDQIRQDFLRGNCCAETEVEKKASAIMELYRTGHCFNGKCERSGKTWWELFADPEYEWQLEENVYYLYRGDVLYEAYSCDSAHPVSRFTPHHGGHDSNKVMVNFSKINNQTENDISAAIKAGTLIFPAADVF